MGEDLQALDRDALIAELRCVFPAAKLAPFWRTAYCLEDFLLALRDAIGVDWPTDAMELI